MLNQYRLAVFSIVKLYYIKFHAASNYFFRLYTLGFFFFLVLYLALIIVIFKNTQITYFRISN